MLRKISEINPNEKDKSILWLHLYEVLTVAKIIETECRMVVSGLEDREMGNYCSMGGVSALQGKSYEDGW